MISKINLSLCVLSVFLVGGFAEQFILESTRVTDWGDWGETEYCPPFHFVYGFRLKIELYGGEFSDDTIVNGIELLCASVLTRHDQNATQNKEFVTITSLVGQAGEFGTILECPTPHFALGFVLRSEFNQLLSDDTAANDLKMFCTDASQIGGYDPTDFGEWTIPQLCPRGMIICGIQTQVEDPNHTDNTALNNVNMVCCDPYELPTAPPTTAP